MGKQERDIKVKQKFYVELLERLNAAHQAESYYEACWLAHAIFEDRTSSVIAHMEDTTGCGRKISVKLKVILKRFDETVPKVLFGKSVKDKKTGKELKKPKWPTLRNFERELFTNIQGWIGDWVNMADSLAFCERSLEDTDTLISELSEEALNLATDLCIIAHQTGLHEMRQWPQGKLDDDSDRICGPGWR